MVTLNAAILEKIHSHMLSILLAVDQVCRKHALTYYLSGGTLLGAVRHGGFIPWDDDLDIALPRPDYDRFLALAQEHLPEHLRLKHFTCTRYYPFTYAKVDDTRTTLIESSTGYVGGVFIDVFPLDGVPDSGEKRYQSYLKRRIQYRNFLIACFGGHDRVFKYDKLLRVFQRVMRCLAVKKIQRRYERFAHKLEYDTCSFIAEKGYGFPKIWVGKPFLWCFEGQEFYIPEQYDQLLTGYYGPHYMELPPPDMRQTNHRIHLIDFHRSYLDYQDAMFKPSKGDV